MLHQDSVVSTKLFGQLEYMHIMWQKQDKKSINKGEGKKAGKNA